MIPCYNEQKVLLLLYQRLPAVAVNRGARMRGANGGIAGERRSPGKGFGFHRAGRRQKRDLQNMESQQ